MTANRHNRPSRIPTGAPADRSASPGGWCASNLILAMTAALLAAVIALEILNG